MASRSNVWLFRSAIATIISASALQANAEINNIWLESNKSLPSSKLSKLSNIPEKFFLNISINSTDLSGLYYAEIFKDGRLILTADAWSNANLIYSGKKYSMGNGQLGYDLNSVNGLSFQIDVENQSIKISAPSESFGMADLTNQDEPLSLKLTSTFGVYMNYNITGTSINAQGMNSYGALLEGIAFNSYGSLVSSMSASVSDKKTKVVRDNTYFQRDNPSSMQKLIIGDATSNAGAWSRPVRFGGLAWSSDFALRKGYVSSATPSINGSAALPSTVEVLIENQRRKIDLVNAGPFQIANLPTPNGAGQVSVIVKDILGNETITTQDFYSSSLLLAQGQSAFSFEAGLLRMNYGTTSSSYEAPMASGTYRRGFDGVTIEGRSELQADRAAAGVDIAANLNNFAVVHASVSSSKTDGQLGFHQIVGFERSSKKMNISIQAENFDQSFVQFGALSTEAKPHRKIMFGLGGNLYKNVSASANIVSQSNWHEDAFKFSVVNISFPIYKDIRLNTYINNNFSSADRYSLGFNIAFPLSNGKSLALSSYSDSKGKMIENIEYAASIDNDNGISYRLSASNDTLQSLRANISANTPFNNINFDLSNTIDSSTLRLNMSGSLGLLGGLPFASAYIGNGSFAVVKVADKENVDVYQSNRKVSKTNSSGLALIPNLVPYEKNTISINPEDLSFDLEINETSKVIIPYARSGSFVNLDIKRTNNRLVRILTADGVAVRSGINVHVLPGNTNFLVAKRGEVYLTNLNDENTITVPLPNGHCTAKVLAPINSSEKNSTITAVCI